MDFLAHTAQQKTKCVTWHIETKSITRVKREFRTKYQVLPFVRNSILRLVDNFHSDGNVRNTTRRGIPPVIEQTINHVCTHFLRHSRRSLRRAESNLSILYPANHKILKRLIPMFPYIIAKVQHLTEDDKINLVEFTQWC